MADNTSSKSKMLLILLVLKNILYFILNLCQYKFKRFDLSACQPMIFVAQLVRAGGVFYELLKEKGDASLNIIEVTF